MAEFPNHGPHVFSPLTVSIDPEEMWTKVVGWEGMLFSAFSLLSTPILSVSGLE